jgi:polyhydroxyalkanoate synthesis regulator phasin
MVILKHDAARLQEELDAIEQRLGDLEAERQDEG